MNYEVAIKLLKAHLKDVDGIPVDEIIEAIEKAKCGDCQFSFMRPRDTLAD